MAKLYFRYGAMNSSKTANMLMAVHNYESQGKSVVVLKPSSDTRVDKDIVRSRVGIEHEAISISEEDNIVDVIMDKLNRDTFSIFVDEVQFFTKEHIRQLSAIVDECNIPVLCYGLKNSYVDGEIFESVRELLYQANVIEETKSVCQCNGCNKASSHHIRVLNGQVIRDGNPVNIGDVDVSEDYFVSCCRKHYYTFTLD